MKGPSMNAQRGNSLVWLLIAVVLISAAVYYFYFLKDRDEAATEIALPPPEIEVATPVETAPEADTEPDLPLQQAAPVEEETEPGETLPELQESDAQSLEAATELLGEGAVQNWLVKEGVVSKFVAAIDALTRDEVPESILPLRGPGGAFEATSDDRPADIDPETGLPVPQFVLDPVNYQRYTAQVELLEALDVDQLLGRYDTFYPLLQQAYRELGYADADFEDRLVEVIDHLLAAPEPEQPVRLLKPEAFYVFADPELESLSAGQKALVRMGPENAARTKAKLSEIRNAIQTQRE